MNDAYDSGDWMHDIVVYHLKNPKVRRLGNRTKSIRVSRE
jgi:hypothetical protein